MGNDQEVVDRDLEVLEEEGQETEPSFFADPKRIAQTLVVVLLLVAAIYVLVPKVFDTQNALGKLGDANAIWIAVALAFNVLAFFSYVALFRGVVGERVLHLEWRESYQITMAGLAATRLFSAGGAGGIVLTYWALRKAGMPRRQTACRMVAFLVLLYAVYMLALVLDGILLRTGVLNGPNPAGLTIVPAALAGAAIAVFLLIALIPEDVERRLAQLRAGVPVRGATRSAWPAGRPPSRAARARRSASSATRRGAGSRCSAPSASGRPTSASSGPRSTPTTSRSRSGSSCRDSSSAWSPTCSRSRPGGWGPWTRG